MRKLPVATIISMICHGAAIAWVVRDGGVLAVPLRIELAPRPVPEPASDAARMVEPLSVVLLDDEREPARDAGARLPDRAASRRNEPRAVPAIAVGASHQEQRASEPAISVEGARGAEEHDLSSSRRLTMRGRKLPRLELSEEFVEDFLAHSKPVPPPPDIPGERIANEIADVRWRMRYAARHNPDQVEALRHELVALYNERAAEELKPAGSGTYVADKETFSAKVSADGSVQLKDKPDRLDRQDKLMLRMGIDPYARNKLALLDRTRDQRVAVGERHRRVQLERATQLMLRNIDRLWAIATDLAARKAGLFELWDDCAETGSEEIVAAGIAARTLVIGVIRGRLRGADAYTSAELAQLNARRRSSAVFAPYE